MSEHEANCLSTGEYLTTGDYLSDSLTDTVKYFLIMQTDGNVCWYKGSGPDDSHGLIWSALSSSLETGDYFLIMQDDGNLCAYRGTGPSDNQGLVWETGTGSNSAGDYSLMFALLNDPAGAFPALVVTKGVCQSPNDPEVSLIWEQLAY